MFKHRITHYTVVSPRLSRDMTFAIATDLHNGRYADVLPVLRQADAILVVGDLLNRHRNRLEHAVAFLQDAPQCAPTYFSIGNHERKSELRDIFFEQLEKSDVTLLDNRYVSLEGVVLGGYTSKRGDEEKAQRNEDFFRDFTAQPGFKLLMCHHPEYYPRYIAGHDVDLTVSGHAHGGQVALGNISAFAPGQGFLPQWTHGFYFDRHLLVSRGMTNGSRAPRIGVPRELIMLHLKAQK